MLTNPVYAGAYTYGKTRRERYVDVHGLLKQRSRRVPITEWAVLLRDHHPGFIDWVTFEANQMRIDANVHPQPHQAGGAVREGTALLQGSPSAAIVVAGCARTIAAGHSTPGYHCAGKDIVNGRGVYCLNVGGVAIDQAVATAFLDCRDTGGRSTRRCSPSQQLQAHHDAALAQWRLAVERARYDAERAERRYRMVEPENRLVARGLEAEWEKRLRDIWRTAEAELLQREHQQPRSSARSNAQHIHALGTDLRQVWAALDDHRSRSERTAAHAP